MFLQLAHNNGRLTNSWNNFILNTLINICLDILVKIIIVKAIFVFTIYCNMGYSLENSDKK